MTMNKKTVANLLILMSFSNMVQSENPVSNGYQEYSNVFKPANQKFQSHKKSKKKPVKTIDFIPEQAFGGNQAAGIYNPKNQTATISNGDQTYNFIKITQQRTNATLLDKKNLDPNLQLIGSFSSKTNHAGMPVTMYIFGVDQTNLVEKIKNNVEKIKNKMSAHMNITPPSQEEIKNIPMGSNPATYAPMLFQPADQFAGNGLIGNYFASSHVATIHDPSGNNHQSYTFKNIQEGGIEQPEDAILIGSFMSKPRCSSNICSHAIVLVNLYGTLQSDEKTDQDIPVQ
jgi:hypothetical protein